VKLRIALASQKAAERLKSRKTPRLLLTGKEKIMKNIKPRPAVNIFMTLPLLGRRGQRDFRLTYIMIPPLIVETNPQIKKNIPSRTLISVPPSCDGVPIIISKI
jgi:hypothetical protein